MLFYPCKFPPSLCTAALSAVALFSVPAFAALMITDPNATYTIDFDSSVPGVNNGAYTGAGISPTPGPGKLDSSAWATTGLDDGDTAFDGGPYTLGTHAQGASEAAVTFGGFWGFDVLAGAGVNRALGIQPAALNWEPGTLTLRLQNTSGAEITQFALAYLVYVRNDQARANSFNFSHSADDVAYIPVSALDVTSPLASTGTDWSSTPRGTTLAGLSIPDNGFYYLRWSGDDAGGVGSRDEFALDDIVLSEFVTASAPIPEPGTLALLAIGGVMVIRVATKRTYSPARRSASAISRSEIEKPAQPNSFSTGPTAESKPRSLARKITPTVPVSGRWNCWAIRRARLSSRITRSAADSKAQAIASDSPAPSRSRSDWTSAWFRTAWMVIQPGGQPDGMDPHSVATADGMTI